ncbi:short-chain dehydrogenase [Blastocladiella britannica]|nr:short-chain dehydrogenase [Blastocladiella britannica]
MAPANHPVYIVTGASRGYGAAIVRQLLNIDPNCTVLGTARAADKLAALQRELPADRFHYVAGDITSESVARELVDYASTLWGRIDALVHNAGVLEPVGKIADVPMADVRAAFDVNLFSVIQLTKAALPLLRAATPGRIVLVSSGAASKAYHGWAAYSATKAALNMLAESLAVEEPGVVTVALRPGVLDTDMQAQIRALDPAKMPGSHAWFVQTHSEGKLVDPMVSAHVAAALAVRVTADLSGKFIDWQGDETRAYQLQ